MSDNSNDDTFSTDRVSQARSPFVTVAWGVAAIAMVLLAIALLLPAVRTPREASRRNDCLAHLRDLAIAIQNYTDENGHLPPAYTVDAEGNRLHSWRTLLLPYMEEKPLYDKIDLTKPWDDPANAEAREQSIPPLMCASAPFEGEHLTSTTYLAVVGPDCAFSGSVPRTLAEIKDGTRTTMTVIDAPYSRAVHWMSPHDISVEEVLALSPESEFSHPGDFHAAFLDGHVKALPQDIDRETLRGILTIAGGEEIEGVEF